MTPSRNKLLVAGLLACSAFASSGVFAQSPPPPPAAGAQSATPPGAQPPGRHEGREHGRRGDPAKRFEQMQAAHARHLADLKAKLKLTPAQEGAWTTFTAAQQPPARPSGDPRARWEEFKSMTTPQRLDRMQQRETERNAHMTQRADATRAFYATLTPEQQKTFDAESLPHFGPGGPGDHGGPRGPGGPDGRHMPPPPPPTKG